MSTSSLLKTGDAISGAVLSEDGRYRYAEEAWLAGILEGEGSFILQEIKPSGPRHRYGYVTARISLAMTDRDVVLRAAQICGRTDLVRSEKKPVGQKQSWRLAMAKQEDVERVLLMVRPWMMARRGRKIDELLAHLERRRGVRENGQFGNANRDKTKCPKNHPYDEDNTRINQDGSRACRTCHRERQRQ